MKKWISRSSSGTSNLQISFSMSSGMPNYLILGWQGLAQMKGLTHVSTAVVGTMGYAAPEYIQSGRLTSKSDVWSYGVFLYELLTGKRPLDRNRPKNEQKLLEWVKPYLSKKRFQHILDPRLEGRFRLRSAQNLLT